MHIQVKLFATLKENRFDVKDFDISPGLTIEEIIGMIGIPSTTVMLILVNGRHAERDTKLTEGATLALFPPIGGG